MKFSYISSLPFLFLVAPTLGLPLVERRTNDTVAGNRNPNRNRVILGNLTTTACGAAYFLTNQPDGNFVVAADIGPDGKLVVRRAVHAGGLGLHANPDGGPDPLVSQSSIKAFASTNMLATVNAGSNTIALFSINPSDPTNLHMIGKPVGSGGEFPVSVAFNKDGSRVCSLNGGAVNGVACFKVDSARGLISLANTTRSLSLNQTTPPMGPENTVSQVIFTEDGSKLIVGVKGIRPDPGFLAIWNVEQDGSLSPDFIKVTSRNGGLRAPFGMTNIPGKDAVLVGDPGVGFDLIGQDGKVDVAVTIDGRIAPGWTSFSPKTGNFYITDVGTSIVTEVNVDADFKGSIVKRYEQTKGSAIIDNDIATIGNNDFMYILASNATAINVLQLNSPGEAQAIQTLNLADSVKNSELAISAANLQGMTTIAWQQNSTSIMARIMAILPHCRISDPLVTADQQNAFAGTPNQQAMVVMMRQFQNTSCSVTHCSDVTAGLDPRDYVRSRGFADNFDLSRLGDLRRPSKVQSNPILYKSRV
ncbi:hypothetical protein HGRIS_003945 [Hohenbuehelia grisea]|uniref:Uncharacterized protein n=1 Tax=Hohenbuehelia grisea TaxID=104357 RepID=A0ABR3JHH1_9AGAR